MKKRMALLIAVMAVCCWGVAYGQDLPKLPFKLDSEYQYRFSFAGQDIGFQSFKVSAAKRKGKSVYLLEEKLDLQGKDASQKGSSRLVLDRELAPLEYKGKLEVITPSLPLISGKFEMSYEFTPGKVLVRITRNGKTYQEMDVYIDPKVYCVSNNKLSQFALLVSKIFPHMKDKVKLRVFHLDTARVLDFELEKGKLEPVNIGDKTYQAHRCPFRLDGQPIGFFFITPEGLLVQDIEKRGQLVIQLADTNKPKTREPAK